jgi:hypothetical protein
MNQVIEQAIIDHTNKVWEQALKIGMTDERERIIKLLGVFSHNIKELPMRHLIELIDGKTK